MADKKTPELIKVSVICEFIDKTNGIYRKVGTEFEVSKKRAKELIALGFVV